MPKKKRSERGKAGAPIPAVGPVRYAYNKFGEAIAIPTSQLVKILPEEAACVDGNTRINVPGLQKAAGGVKLRLSKDAVRHIHEQSCSQKEGGTASSAAATVDAGFTTEAEYDQGKYWADNPSFRAWDSLVSMCSTMFPIEMQEYQTICADAPPNFDSLPNDEKGMRLVTYLVKDLMPNCTTAMTLLLDNFNKSFVAKAYEENIGTWKIPKYTLLSAFKRLKYTLELLTECDNYNKLVPSELLEAKRKVKDLKRLVEARKEASEANSRIDELKREVLEAKSAAKRECEDIMKSIVETCKDFVVTNFGEKTLEDMQSKTVDKRSEANFPLNLESSSWTCEVRIWLNWMIEVWKCAHAQEKHYIERRAKDEAKYEAMSEYRTTIVSFNIELMKENTRYRINENLMKQELKLLIAAMQSEQEACQVIHAHTRKQIAHIEKLEVAHDYNQERCELLMSGADMVQKLTQELRRNTDVNCFQAQVDEQLALQKQKHDGALEAQKQYYEEKLRIQQAECRKILQRQEHKAERFLLVVDEVHNKRLETEAEKYAELGRAHVELINELETLTARNAECVVCLSAESIIAMMPCGHRCACEECSLGLKHCPLCRADVNGTVKIFG